MERHAGLRRAIHGSTTANSNTYAAEGQFGGAGQAGVVGHASGPAFRSVFYGEKD